MRLIKAVFPTARVNEVLWQVKQHSTIDATLGLGNSPDQKSIEILISASAGQDLIKGLEETLASSEDWRLTVLPVEATLPRVEANQDGDEPAKHTVTIQEELYQTISRGTLLDRDFLALTVLSTIVATIGLNASNIAVIIGAMVIAPLLGPILAFAYGGALGDLALMIKAGKTAIIGLLTGFGVALILSFMMDVNLLSSELLDRATLSPEIIILALASGAAAALSLSSGISSALVGVMVAVALLPPAASAALFLGAGELNQAINASLLLALNVICIMVSAQLTFVIKGIGPQTWIAKKTAAVSVKINLGLWLVLLIVLAVLSLKISADIPAAAI